MTRPSGAVVFDLDDTLYLERDFVLSGFAAVGRWLRRTHGIAGFEPAAVRLFEAGRRGDIFDAALAELGASNALVPELVDRYRSHRPRIALAPDAERWLAAAPPGWALALITDGPVESQAGKVRALGLRRRGFCPVILTDRWGPAFRKPHPRAYEAVMQRLRLPPGRCLYIADNAGKDFAAPNRLGWATVQLTRPLGLHQGPPPAPGHAPQLRLQTLDGFDPRALLG
jgi:putative hydrolase of the HAD superfamily